MTIYPELPDLMLEPMIRAALAEDLGQLGDITSRIVVPAGTTSTARLVARQSGVASGMQVARVAFNVMNKELQVKTHIPDGSTFEKGAVLMTVSGDTHAILSAERIALNYSGRLCGIATQAAAYVAETKGTNTRVTCTRKTTPGLRLVEKQAVLHGGGSNHRFGLGDAILIKDNHIAAAGGVSAVLERARNQVSHMMRIEIEVDTLEQLDEVLSSGGADVVLLDNMDTPTLIKAVEVAGDKIITEASGNMTLPRIAEVAATGVDYISVGALTHSATTLDIGLDF